MRLNMLAGAAVLLAVCGAATAAPFTFQGELRDGGTPVNGTYDFQFLLCGAPVGGVIFGPTLCSDNVVVANGRFTVVLDFGNVFDGTDRFLEIQLRSDTGLGCGNSSGFGLLGPRAQVTNAPMAGFASEAGTAANATSAANATNLNGQPATFYQNATNLTGTLADARLSANVPRLNSATSTFTGGVTATAFTGSGSALTSLNAGNLASGTVADARLSSNIPKLNASNTFAGAITALNFSGSGSLLTGLNANNISMGTVADNLLSGNVALESAANTFTAINTFNTRVGIGSAPAAMLHVSGGASGATASASSEMVIEDNAAAYLQILTPDTSERGIAFGSPTNGFEGGVYYTNAGGLSLRTGGNDARMTISPAGAVTFSGPVTIPTTTRYLMLSGLSFTNIGGVSRASELLMSSGSGATQTAMAPVTLPHGATVTNVAVMGSDTSINNFTLYMQRRSVDPMTGQYADVAVVPSTGSAGTITKWSTSSIGFGVIDNNTYIYFVLIQFPGGTAFQDLVVHAVRITYTVDEPLP